LGARRLRAGEPIVLFDGAGTEAEARIVSAGGRERLCVELAERRVVPQPPGSCLTVAVAAAKGSRQIWLAEKLTELGVGAIWGVNFARSAARIGRATIERWRRRAIEAAKQSQQAWLPQILIKKDLRTIIGQADGFGLRLVGGLGRPLLPVLREATARSTLMVVGPEGGLTAPEVAALEAAGFQTVRVGCTTLRVETAAVATASVIVAYADASSG
jgi:16S rRNA (uracil1498-N3)-methyltransferase